MMYYEATRRITYWNKWALEEEFSLNSFLCPVRINVIFWLFKINWFFFNMFSFAVNGCLANKYEKPPVFANSLLAGVLFCSTVVVTVCLVLTGLNLSNGYD